MRWYQWAIALVLAVGVHLALAVALGMRPEVEASTAADAGEFGVEIGLGSEGAYQDQAEQKVAEVEAPVEPEPEPRPEPPKPEVKPPVEMPKPVVPEVATVEPPKVKEDDIQVAKQAPEKEPEPEPEPKQPEPPKPEAAKPVETQAPPSETARTADTAREAMVKASGRANSRTAGGRQGNAKSYFAELMAWLNRHKEYPSNLKRAKIEGTVMVRFSISRDGEVLDASIKTSSGNAQLDQAALDMLKKANPLPAIPDFMGRDRISITVPVGVNSPVS